MDFETYSNLSSLVGSLYDISLGTLDRLGAVSSDNHGLGMNGGVSIDMNSEHDLDDITILEDGDILV